MEKMQVDMQKMEERMKRMKEEHDEGFVSIFVGKLFTKKYYRNRRVDEAVAEKSGLEVKLRARENEIVELNKNLADSNTESSYRFFFDSGFEGYRRPTKNQGQQNENFGKQSRINPRLRNLPALSPKN